MITIRQIAKEAKVSVATVSRVINNRAHVSSENRSRIQAIIDKYEYVPNSKAVSLSIGRSRNIGVIIPYSSSIEYYNTISNGIILEAFHQDMRVTFLPTDYDRKKELEYLKLLKSREFDGMVIVSATNPFREIARFGEERIVCCEDVGEIDLRAVYIERDKAILEIIGKYKVADASKVGLTFSRDEKTSVASRKVMSALKNHFGEFPISQIYRNARTYQDGYEAGVYFHGLGVDLILSNGDEVAAGVLKYYEKHRFPLPLIMGQDNTPIAKVLNLPTVDFHIKDIGKIAVQNLLSGEQRKICLGYTIYDRSSTLL